MTYKEVCAVLRKQAGDGSLLSLGREMGVYGSNGQRPPQAANAINRGQTIRPQTLPNRGQRTPVVANNSNSRVPRAR